jgi:hypothetical protein
MNTQITPSFTPHSPQPSNQYSESATRYISYSIDLKNNYESNPFSHRSYGSVKLPPLVPIWASLSGFLTYPAYSSSSSAFSFTCRLYRSTSTVNELAVSRVGAASPPSASSSRYEGGRYGSSRSIPEQLATTAS